jgi:hypothetical protein
MEKAIIAVSILCLALLAAVVVLAVQPTEVVTKEVVVTETVIDNSSLAMLEALSAKVDSLEEFTAKSDETLQNDTAKALVEEELSTKAFLKDILAFIEANDDSEFVIDSYKDLEVYATKLISSDVDDDEAVVVYQIKVKGFYDEDEELDFRAKLNVEFTVSDLVIDDLFEDSSVDYDFTEAYFYD